MRCVLIYNPASGRNRHRRDAILRQICEALSDLGHVASIVPTIAPGSATDQAREAAARGADIVFACGGDGTVHEVLQGLVCENCAPACALGIIPLGSANALARHLRISLHPMRAALQEICGITQTIPIGKLTFGDRIRYFAVMAGAGPDGALVYNLLAAQKSNLGRLAYYLHAARLFTTRRFHPFEVEFTATASNAAGIRQAVSVMATRIGNLGGLFANLTGGNANIDDPHLRLLILGGPALLSLPLWFVLGWLNLNRLNPFLTFMNVTGFCCRSASPIAPYFQADGEWLGQIPMQASIVPHALRILLPQRKMHLQRGRNIGCG